MRHLQWFYVVVVCIFIAAPIHAQESPSLTRIGRGAIQSVEWHPTGNYILVSTVTGAWLYTPDLQDLKHIPDAHLATLSGDGRYIAGVDDTHHIRLWDAITFEPVDSPDNGHFRRVWALSWSPDGRYLAASGEYDEGYLYVWDFFNAQDVVVASRNTGDDLIWSPKGNYLLAHSTTYGGFSVIGIEPSFYSPILTRGSANIWQDETNILVMNYGEYTEATRWDILTGEQGGRFSSSASAVAFNHTGDVLTLGNFEDISMIDAKTNEQRLEINVDLDLDRTWINTVAWSHDDRWIAVGINIGSRAKPTYVVLIDTHTGTIVHRLGGMWENIRQVVWSSDDRFIGVVDERQQLYIFDASLGETIGYSPAHTFAGETLAWSPDGQQLAVAGSNDKVTLWSTTQPIEQIREFPNNGSPITDLKWQPGGNLIVFQGRDRIGWRQGWLLTFQIRDVDAINDANITNPLESLTESLTDFFDWQPEGKRLITIFNNSIYLWDTTTGEIEIRPLPEEIDTVDAVDIRVSPSGRYLAILMSGIGTSGSYIYDFNTGKFALVGTSVPHSVVAWSPDDQLITLTWGTWGDPTPSSSIAPMLSRLAAPEFSLASNSLKSSSLHLSGLLHNTLNGFLSPQGQYAAAVDGAGSGMVWDALDGTPVAMLADTAQIVWSPDETHFVVQRLDGSILLSEAHGSILEQLPISASMQKPSGTFFWSPDGNQLAHLHDGVVDVWRIDE